MCFGLFGLACKAECLEALSALVVTGADTRYFMNDRRFMVCFSNPQKKKRYPGFYRNSAFAISLALFSSEQGDLLSSATLLPAPGGFNRTSRITQAD
jgi:hypothetical protein